MVSKDSLMKIRQDVENYVGQEICVKANVGRNKCIERKGYIDSTYTNLFVFSYKYFGTKFTKWRTYHKI